MSGFDQPNYTMVPNKLFELMPRMKEAELRVTLAIVRQTFGYIDADTGKRKAEDELSLTQLEHKTGLSRQAVVNGTSQGLERGTLARRPVGNSFAYHLVLSTVVNEVDQSTKLTSQASRPKAVNEVDRQVVNEVDTQKKDLKEKKEKRETQPQAAAATPSGAAPDLLFEAICTACGYDWTKATFTAKKRGMVATNRQILAKVQATPEQVAAFWSWFAQYDFRGRKGERPTPALIVDLWDQFLAFVPGREQQYEKPGQHHSRDRAVGGNASNGAGAAGSRVVSGGTSRSANGEIPPWLQ
jgi:hypothetical protein